MGFEYRVRIWNEERCKVPAYACSPKATELNLSCRQRKLFQPKQISVLCITLHVHANVQFQVLLVSEFPYVKGHVRALGRVLKEVSGITMSNVVI